MLMRVWSLTTVCDVLLRGLLAEFLVCRLSGSFNAYLNDWLEV